MRRRRIQWSAVLGLIGIAVLVGSGIYGIAKLVQAGVRERDAEPPRIVVDREHRTESRRRCTEDMDGYERCRWVTDDYYYLVSREGYTCQVTAREYRVARISEPHKCMQLFGWTE